MKPIDLYNPELERLHRHTEPQWMNYFNLQGHQHQHPQWNKTFNFFNEGSDILKLWLENTKRLPKEWRWHTEKFTYTHNSAGFRNDFELDDVDWSEASVVFGSSVVAGDGVPQSESLAHYVESITGRPCVNLAVPACSCDVVFNNMLKMLHTYGKPKAIYVIWPEVVRQIDSLELLVEGEHTTWMRQDRGPWDIEPHHISSGTCFYRRNQYIWCVRHLFSGVQYSEMFETHFDVIPGDKGHGYTEHNVLQIHTPFPDSVSDEIASDKPYGEWSHATKMWYLNEFCARDVSAGYDGVRNPKDWTHFGKFVNQAVAQYFIETQKTL